MTVISIIPASIALARASLDDACRQLDDAVRALSEDGSETVMANADLVARLLRVVSARHHLARLGPPASLR